ncbi:MAG: porphobilinogen deaminase [Chloroflexota bacterium]|nr:hydroxymethylbilane synthase [Chloroflexota bacterium]NOG63380.1 hydroxymethylbilane synthase [Chloroflexota bacterium]GIK62240.1 MAG: porphobilinogen deaminase [Chloroflexota bacterium]
MSAVKTLRFGTRGSDLALWQTRYIMKLMEEAVPALHLEYEIIKTRGDTILHTPLPLVGGKGVFTAELESAIYEKRIDCAVHSLKDLPTEQPDGLVIGATPIRANPADVLISRRGYTLATLPNGARVGTSSTRRAAQLRHLRPDLNTIDIRGNVDTRIQKALAKDGDYDAIVLAFAGLERLERLEVVSEVLDFADMLPAPGQGAIAVQTRDEPTLLETLRVIHHQDTALAITAERAFLAGLGGGCSVPVAAYAQRQNGQWVLRGRVSAPGGTQQIDVTSTAIVNDEQAAYTLGIALAQEALAKGAKALMEQRL